MGTNAKRKSTMAKRDRENAVRERRVRKAARKEARKQAAADAANAPSEAFAGDGDATPDGDPPTRIA
jgi:hypothetical protein